MARSVRAIFKKAKGNIPETVNVKDLKEGIAEEFKEITLDNISDEKATKWKKEYENWAEDKEGFIVDAMAKSFIAEWTSLSYDEIELGEKGGKGGGA